MEVEALGQGRDSKRVDQERGATEPAIEAGPAGSQPAIEAGPVGQTAYHKSPTQRG